MAFQMIGGQFYVESERETIVDPFIRPTAGSQNQLLLELRKCDDLMQRDLRYAHLVAGASKMPMHMIWTNRNPDISDTDLAAFKDLAWNEFVKRRYLPGISGTRTVSEAAASMLEIVREMNLQRRRFVIMGLHEQVEASEIQLVLHLCQAGIIHSTNYRASAIRYRRSDRLHEAFALAVGAFVCSSAPYTLGSGTGRYERDLQFEYKKQTTALFVYALRQHFEDGSQLEEDYVARIARLIVVSPDDDDVNGKAVGFRANDCDDKPDCCMDAKLSSVTDTAVEARGKAERAGREIEGLKAKVDASGETVRLEFEAMGRVVADLKDQIKRSELQMERVVVDLKDQIKRSELQSDSRMREWKNALDSQVADLNGRIRDNNSRNDSELKGLKDSLTAEIIALRQQNEMLLQRVNAGIGQQEVELTVATQIERLKNDIMTLSQTTMQSLMGNFLENTVKQSVQTEVNDQIGAFIKQRLEMEYTNMMQTFNTMIQANTQEQMEKMNTRIQTFLDKAEGGWDDFQKLLQDVENFQNNLPVAVQSRTTGTPFFLLLDWIKHINNSQDLLQQRIDSQSQTWNSIVRELENADTKIQQGIEQNISRLDLSMHDFNIRCTKLESFPVNQLQIDMSNLTINLIPQLRTQIRLLESTNESVNLSINSVMARVSLLESTNSSANTTLQLQQIRHDVDLKVQTVDQQVQSVETNIQAMKGDFQTMQGNVQVLQTKIQTIEQNKSENTMSEVQGLNERVKSSETDRDRMQVEINSIQEKIITLDGSLQELAVKVDSVLDGSGLQDNSQPEVQADVQSGAPPSRVSDNDDESSAQPSAGNGADSGNKRFRNEGADNNAGRGGAGARVKRKNPSAIITLRDLSRSNSKEKMEWALESIEAIATYIQDAIQTQIDEIRGIIDQEPNYERAAQNVARAVQGGPPLG